MFKETRQQVCLCGVFFVMNPKILFGKLSSQLHNFWVQAIKTNTLFIIGAKYQWLTVFEVDGLARPRFLICKQFKGAVIKNDAVLQNFQHGCSFMFTCTKQHFL